MLSLGLLSIGEKGEVVGIRQKGLVNQCMDVKDDLCARIENMGLRVGKIVEMLSNQGQGPLLVKVDNTRIAVARNLAMKRVSPKKSKKSQDRPLKIRQNKSISRRFQWIM